MSKVNTLSLFGLGQIVANTRRIARLGEGWTKLQASFLTVTILVIGATWMSTTAKEKRPKS